MLNIAFVKQHIHNVLKIFFFLIFKYSSTYIPLQEIYVLIFYKCSYSQSCFDVAQPCGNRSWKWQRCFDVVERYSNQCRNRQSWFDFVQRCKFQLWHTQRCFNVDLTLLDVANSYQPKKHCNVCWARSLVHKKKFSLIWQVVFKLGYFFWVWMDSEKSHKRQ